MTLFDQPAPEAARDDALGRVEEHADTDWAAAAERIVHDLLPGVVFTTDAVWEQLAREGHTTHEPRALGAVMMRLARQRKIVKTGAYTPSTRREAHARPIPLWRRTL